MIPSGGVRLRRKITFAFFGVSTLVSVLLALVLYRFIESALESDLRARLRDLAYVGSHGIDRDAYGRLVDQLTTVDAAPAGPARTAAVDAIERSADFQRISEQLNVIRRAEPRLIRYVYLLVPSPDRAAPRFVVDSDVLALRAAGPRAAEAEISHFGQPYDISAIPVLARALAQCSPQVETEFVRDEAYRVSSVSAYYPLPDVDDTGRRDPRGRCVGVLGVDITDAAMREALAHAGGLALKISLGVIALALLVSIAMSTVLTRSILALSTTVKRFADKDFTARTPVLTRDEIGQLGTSFNQMADTIQLHHENLEDLVHQRTKELSAEKQTSERLLLNVLPGPIADRLKTGESLIVDRFDAVSVLFADIVGFTALSARTTPEALVTMLNELFSAFDRLAATHGLEKIKTIGDAYMVVGGIPQPRADHAAAITRMGLDMQDAIAAYATRTGSDLTIRIGIHSGSVVAGVIGENKFIYDLWGDTVNTASRMESAGVAGRVHVSEATAADLRDHFELEARGPIEIKGKGLMSTFLVTVRPAPTA